MNMITILMSDLPFLRFVKRHQVANSCLRRINEHPQLSQLEQGRLNQIQLEIKASEQELARLTLLNEWWEKAEYQGISTRLLDKIFNRTAAYAA